MAGEGAVWEDVACRDCVEEIGMKPVSRRSFLKTGAAAVAASSVLGPEVALAQRDAPRKNVLFIGVDDLNTSLGCYGNTVVKTPHLDALAARGVRFDRAYCQYPLCNPSRSSLMTGLAPDTVKVYDLQTRFRKNLPDAVTIAELFRRNGYRASRVGKIFHTDVPGEIGENGLDDPQSWDSTFNPDGIDHTQEEVSITNLTPNRHHLGNAVTFYESPAADKEMTDSRGADEVIRILRAKHEKPFFLAYGLYRPHVSWIVPKAYFDMYPLESIEARPFDPKELTLAPRAAYWTQPPNFGMDELARRKAIRAYYASVSFMDAQVGRVLAELKALGLEDDTVVVFWADHGWNLGEHGQWMKQSLFETAARVPLIFAGPGVRASGQVCERTVEHLDVYPTLAELCGLHGAPKQMQGASLMPLLDRPSSAWEKPAVSQVFRPSDARPRATGYSLRDERYRYTLWRAREGGEELYDYQTDPHELTNLAEHPELQAVKAVMRTKLDAISAARGRESKA
jgi:iduronate 2-sulfatase